MLCCCAAVDDDEDPVARRKDRRKHSLTLPGNMKSMLTNHKQHELISAMSSQRL